MGKHAVLMCRLNSSGVYLILLFVIVNVTDMMMVLAVVIAVAAAANLLDITSKFHTTATFMIVHL
jgi:hypothetical protein